MARIKLLETTVTKGYCMGEKGVSHHLLGPDDTPAEGDISRRTSGYYQGYDRIIEAELEEGYTLYRNQAGGVSIADPNGAYVTHDADTALDMGILHYVVQTG